MRSLVLLFVGAAAALLGIAMLFTTPWDHPPIHTAQMGFRGLSLGQLTTDKSEALLKMANKLPDPIDKASPDGPRAKDTYQNVQVLGDLSVEQFNRVMLGMAAWVAPQEQSCAYCHNLQNMADDGLYTKRIARVMIKMTRHINNDYKAHVQNVGVVCYTCHRGAPIISNVWYEGQRDTQGFATDNWGLGGAHMNVGSTGLSKDPFSGYIQGGEKADTSDPIRVQAVKALPSGYGASIFQTEKTYALMIHMSTGLGVNCTYCHNTRAFGNWAQSTPQRVVAWHGIQMVRDLNANYLEALQKEWPADQLGPKGDGPKLNCATCHQGAFKPLLGQSIAKDWPELGGVATQ
jgi:photosynthetic reaction center cytochrome c subunit